MDRSHHKNVMPKNKASKTPRPPTNQARLEKEFESIKRTPHIEHQHLKITFFIDKKLRSNTTLKSPAYKSRGNSAGA